MRSVRSKVGLISDRESRHVPFNNIILTICDSLFYARPELTKSRLSHSTHTVHDGLASFHTREAQK
jgi:hypothetical protein